MLMYRDPFAREELHRETVRATELRSTDTCHWCGQRTRTNTLHRYWKETDGGRKVPIKGLFCSASCYRNY